MFERLNNTCYRFVIGKGEIGWIPEINPRQLQIPGIAAGFQRGVFLTKRCWNRKKSFFFGAIGNWFDTKVISQSREISSHVILSVSAHWSFAAKTVRYAPFIICAGTAGHGLLQKKQGLANRQSYALFTAGFITLTEHCGARPNPDLCRT